MSDSPSEHLLGAIPEGDSNTWMPDIWGYAVVQFDIGRVIDIGCGYGHACKWFSDLGITAVGIDGSEDCILKTVSRSYQFSKMVLHDFTKGKYVHGTPFDLAWCCEFLEHVEEKYLDNVRPCFQSARYAIITHGEPLQDGSHHVNCKPSSYWESMFNSWGFTHLSQITDLLRRTDRFRAAWGRRTLMAFQRK